MESTRPTRADEGTTTSNVLWGIGLAAMGAWWLLHEIAGVPFSWAWIGPAALVIVGLSMVFRRGPC